MASTDYAKAVAERNLALFRRIIEEGFNAGNLAVADEVIASDHREHQPGLAPGPEGLKGTIRYLRSGFPDLTLTVEDITSDGDKVWARLKARGTHQGTHLGFPPTGKRIEIDVIDVCRFQDGQMVEHWGVPDRFMVLAQLGLLPILESSRPA